MCLASARENWSSSMGMLFAALGSAVGLANLYTFPMLTGLNGGAAFVLIYVFWVCFLSWVGLIIEFATGRVAQAGPAVAYEKLGLPFGRLLGAIAVLRPLLVFCWYVSITGWCVGYVFAPLLPQFWGDPVTFFEGVRGSWLSPFLAVVAVVITMLIVALGVRRGLERGNRLMMSALFIILVVLVIRALTLPGAVEGVKYYMLPDFTKITPKVALNAMAQAFFSASLNGAAMVVYGSYLRRKDDVTITAVTTAFGDTLVALLCGFVVWPAALAFNISPKSGTSLLFITIPEVLRRMPAGNMLGVLFFVFASFAALTSTISMVEVAVEGIQQWTNYRVGRVKVVIPLTIVTSIAAALIATYPVIWSYATYIALYSAPLLAILPPIALFWRYGSDKALEEINTGSIKKVGKWFIYWGKYIYPAAILTAYILNIIG